MLRLRRVNKVRHSKIRDKTNVTDALTHALKLKWKWAGHIARMSEDRRTKRTTSWRGPDGKRSIGRPYARWSDDIKGVAGNWKRETTNKSGR
ncbi:hypothetical protein EVAR_85198_1 [Eumeta japonica]|uniref:Endonuclease-reverse transcriptase n=1 Tax=Eumeta variegata TaxID=151549 RepID=A0A4C1W1K0_EUMVA|nr:hypothetical protein EVAR_85198_1 [Eumeta japonica]